MAENKDQFPKGSRQNPNVKGGSSQAGVQSGKVRPNAPQQESEGSEDQS